MRSIWPDRAGTATGNPAAGSPAGFGRFRGAKPLGMAGTASPGSGLLAASFRRSSPLAEPTPAAEDPAANQQFVAPTYSEAAKGLWPRPYSVAPHTILYRFIDASRGAPTSGADGPWWFEFEHFQTIKHFASRNGYSFGYAARLFAAILYEWSEVNAVVRAEVKVPLSVWKGKGKQMTVAQPEIDSRDKNRTPHGLVTERSPQNVSKMTPLQGPLEVYQLYIPGLGRPHHRFDSFFNFLSYEAIQTG